MSDTETTTTALPDNLQEIYTDHVNPMIASLLSAITAGRSPDEEGFWLEIENARVPLVEPAGEEHSFVTFVYKGRMSTQSVAVMLRGIVGCPGDHVLQRVADTEVYFRTYRFGNDLGASYAFYENAPLFSVSGYSTSDMEGLFDYFKGKTPIADAFNLPNPAYVDENQAIAMGFDFSHPAVGGTWMSVLALPEAPSVETILERPGVERGALTRHVLPSRFLNEERVLWVYTPHAYVSSERYPLILAFDASGYLPLGSVHRVLDNLIHDGAIAPVIAVFVESTAERNQQLNCNPDFAAFVTDEVLPWSSRQFGITDEPKERTVMGASLGGLMAVYVAFLRPDLFGHAVSQDGTLSWGPGCVLGPQPRYEQNYHREWLYDQFASSDRREITLHLDVALLTDPRFELYPHRRFKELLVEKGYEHTYQEYYGVHDWHHWVCTLDSTFRRVLPPR